MDKGWTLEQAVKELEPPIPRRTLAALMKDVPPVGAVYGKRGRRAATYPVDLLALAHAGWVERNFPA